MTMTCHVLHAGDGYTYLTEQVASGDIARSAHDPPAGYYTVAGNPPGQWIGAGCADLGVSGVVTEEHMLALFGEGLRPDANEFVAARIAAGDRLADAVVAARLGRRFYQYGQDVPLVAALKTAYARFADHYDRRPTVAERRDIKMGVARTLLAQQFPDRPPPTREQVRRYLTDELGKCGNRWPGLTWCFLRRRACRCCGRWVGTNSTRSSLRCMRRRAGRRWRMGSGRRRLLGSARMALPR